MAATVSNIVAITAFVTFPVFSVALPHCLVPIIPKERYGAGWGTPPILSTEWSTLGCCAELLTEPIKSCFFAGVPSVLIRTPLCETVEAVSRAENWAEQSGTEKQRLDLIHSVELWCENVRGVSLNSNLIVFVELLMTKDLLRRKQGKCLADHLCVSFYILCVILSIPTVHVKCVVLKQAKRNVTRQNAYFMVMISICLMITERIIRDTTEIKYLFLVPCAT